MWQSQEQTPKVVKTKQKATQRTAVSVAVGDLNNVW